MKGEIMFKSKIIYFLILAFILAGLFACNSEKYGESSSTPVQSNPFMAVPANTESVIKGVKIVYLRDSQGCAEKSQFWNDPALCGDNPKCKEYAKDAKAEYMDGLPTNTEPKIAGELIKSAGNTIDTAQLCDEFRIVTHGSPGWAWSWLGGHYELACLGYYYAPWCCDTESCVEKP